MYLARDVYVVTAADIASGAFAGRFYSHQRKAWESVPSVSMAGGSPWPSEPKHHMRAFQFMLLHAATGAVKCGVRVTVWSVINPENPGISTMLLCDGHQHATHLVSWRGDHPVAAGFGWRVYQGGAVAGDIGDMLVLYE